MAIVRDCNGTTKNTGLLVCFKTKVDQTVRAGYHPGSWFGYYTDMDWLLEGSYTVEMPQTYDGYVWSHWLEDGDTNRIKIITLSGSTTYTAVYGIPVGGVSVATESGYWHSRAWSVSILIMVSAVITLSICFKRKSAKE